MKIIKMFTKARLTTCGQRKIKDMNSHKNGCYLKLTNKDVSHSDDAIWTVVDFDKNNEIRGIEFVDGLPNKRKNKE